MRFGAYDQFRSRSLSVFLQTHFLSRPDFAMNCRIIQDLVGEGAMWAAKIWVEALSVRAQLGAFDEAALRNLI